jgi:hypothetical protein
LPEAFGILPDPPGPSANSEPKPALLGHEEEEGNRERRVMKKNTTEGQEGKN